MVLPILNKLPMTEDQLIAKLKLIQLQQEELIQKHGFMVQGVFPTDVSPGPSFSYTIGLYDIGKPELIVFGLAPNIACTLLNAIAAVILNRETALPAVREKLTLPFWAMPFYLVKVPVKKAREFALGAANRSKNKATYFQVVWPDKAGKFPWESGADFSTCPQGYLGAGLKSI